MKRQQCTAGLRHILKKENKVKKQILRKMVLVSVFLGLTACTSMSHKKDVAQIAKVKKVAIVSFVLEQEQQADNLGLGALKSMKDGMVGFMERPQIQKMSRSVYSSLAGHLERVTGKKVLPLKAVINNKVYAQFYRKKMGGKLKTGAFKGSGNKETVYLNGVLNMLHFRKLTQAEKMQLTKALGVDAIVEYYGIQSIEQGWGLGNIMGSGKFAFKTRSNIRMFNRRSDDPILQIQNVDGPKSRSSEDIDGDKYKKLAVLGKESADASIKEAVNKHY